MSWLADQGLADEEHATLSMLNASRYDVPLRSPPFFGEAATPDPRLISFPGGGASLDSPLATSRAPYLA